MFEWQQVSLSLQDSSQYSAWYQQYCTLDGLHTSSYLPAFQLLFHSFGDWAARTNCNWYHGRFHVPYFFSSLARFWYLSLFVFFQFYPVVSRNRKVHNSASSPILLTITRSGCGGGPWGNGYCRRKWTWRHASKSWTGLDCISHSTNTLGKGMNPIILVSSYR